MSHSTQVMLRHLILALTRTPYTTHLQDILKFDLSYWPIYLQKSR